MEAQPDEFLKSIVIKVLKAAREKDNLTFQRTKVTMATDFSSETASQRWNIPLNLVLKGKLSI